MRKVAETVAKDPEIERSLAIHLEIEAAVNETTAQIRTRTQSESELERKKKSRTVIETEKRKAKTSIRMMSAWMKRRLTCERQPSL